MVNNGGNTVNYGRKAVKYRGNIGASQPPFKPAPRRRQSQGAAKGTVCPIRRFAAHLSLRFEVVMSQLL